MFKTRLVFALLLICSLVVAACQPAATATPRPTATSAPATDAVAESATEQAEEPTLAATEATEELVATEEMMATEEMVMTDEAALTAEETVEMAALMTDEMEPTNVSEATEEGAAATMEMDATEDGVEVAVATMEMDMTEEGVEVAIATMEMEMATEEMMATDEVVIASEETVEASPDITATTSLSAADVTMEMTDEGIDSEETVEPGPTSAAVDATMEMDMTAEMEMTAEVEVTDDAATDLANSVMISPDDEVIIGMAASYTSSDTAGFGIDIRNGAELALVDRPTVTVDGVEFTVTLDPQDDLCTAEGGQTVANRYTSDEDVVAVVGPMCSSACLAAAPIFDEAGYTTISPSCTGVALTQSGFTSFNRTVAPDDFQGRIVAAYLYNELGARQIATIHDGSAYGEGLVALVSQYYEELGGEVVAADAVTVGDTDFRGLLEDIAQEDPDLLYFVGFPAEGARLVQQRADVGLEDVQFVSADGLFSPELIEQAGEDVEGVIVSRSVSASSAALEDYTERFIEAYGEQVSAFNANAYDAVNILLDAIEAVGSVDEAGDLVISRAELADYVRNLQDYEGLVGSLSNDGTGEMIVSEYGFAQVTGGEFVEISVGSVEGGEVVFSTPEADAGAGAETGEAEPAGVESTSEMQMTAEATPGS